MTKKQEQELFGNVYDRNIIINNEDAKKIMDIFNSQREAIGALIEMIIHDEYHQQKFGAGIVSNLTRSRYKNIILSAVIQDGWEDVRKVWEENQ